MILFVHNRYRVTGGEERVVDDLIWLVRERLGEDAELFERDSAQLGAGRAAIGMLRGGLHPEDLAAAVRRTGARVVHAHNLHPSLGWRALAAVRAQGARVVLHLHQYRLVCAVGVCFTHGAECTRCHGRNTLPGVLHNCRGRLGESLVYAAGIAGAQPRILANSDRLIVPSEFARGRLAQLGARLHDVTVLPPPLRSFAQGSRAAAGRHALYVGRLSREKGIEVAVEACARAGVPLVVAGEGPLALAPRPGLTLAGRVDDARLDELRAGASVALMPSLSAETFGLAAAEAMAAGVPVAASRIGALPELVPPEGLVSPGDSGALAEAVGRLAGDDAAGARALAAARARCAPETLAPALAEIYS